MPVLSSLIPKSLYIVLRLIHFSTSMLLSSVHDLGMRVKDLISSTKTPIWWCIDILCDKVVDVLPILMSFRFIINGQ